MKYQSLWDKYNTKEEACIINYRKMCGDNEVIHCSLCVANLLKDLSSKNSIDIEVLKNIFIHQLDIPAEQEEGVSKLTWAFANLFLYTELCSNNSIKDVNIKFIESDPTKKHLYQAEQIVISKNCPFYINSSEDLYL